MWLLLLLISPRDLENADLTGDFLMWRTFLSIFFVVMSGTPFL